MLRVAIQIGDEPARVLSFQDLRRVRFGRSRENEIVLWPRYVSRFHGEFVFEDGNWYVRDQGSQMGTLLTPGDAPECPRELRSQRGGPLVGGEELRICDARMRIEIKAVQPRTDPPGAPSPTVVARVAETQISKAPSLEEALFRDRRKLALVLALAKDLNALQSLDEVLRRISRTVFEALVNATHFSVCIAGPGGIYRPEFGVLRDGSELDSDEIGVSRSILELAVERQAAMLFRITDPAVDVSQSIVVNSIGSSIAVPLGGLQGNAGVLLVDNRSSSEAFEVSDLDYLIVLANHATSALERAQFRAEIERVFEGFVAASVAAIEARDPTTSGHSRRVADYCLALAEAVNRVTTGPLAEVAFSGPRLTELSYAALLHDFGKVGVRERVLVKERRLHPEQMAAVEARLRLARASREGELLRGALLSDCDALPRREALSRLRDEAAAFDGELEDALALIRELQEGRPLSASEEEYIRSFGLRSFDGPGGEPVRFLTDDELEALCIRRGTLTDAQRREIESHVEHSVAVLGQIPWPKTMRRVPEIVHAHHERLDGSGYPRGRTASEISLESRLLAVCDIFDALTAADRPYRSAMPVESALDLLREEARRGRIDPDVVDLFIDSEVWRS